MGNCGRLALTLGDVHVYGDGNDTRFLKSVLRVDIISVGLFPQGEQQLHIHSRLQEQISLGLLIR